MSASTQGSSPTGKVVVLDTGAILAGVPLATPLKCYTIVEVVEEVRDSESRAVLERAVEAGRVEVVEPSSSYVRVAESLARRAGTLGYLSSTDLKVIALAVELKDKGLEVVIASDDYKVQRTALEASIEVLRVRYRGVREIGSKR